MGDAFTCQLGGILGTLSAIPANAYIVLSLSPFSLSLPLMRQVVDAEVSNLLDDSRATHIIVPPPKVLTIVR